MNNNINCCAFLEKIGNSVSVVDIWAYCPVISTVCFSLLYIMQIVTNCFCVRSMTNLYLFPVLRETIFVSVL